MYSVCKRTEDLTWIYNHSFKFKTKSHIIKFAITFKKFILFAQFLNSSIVIYPSGSLCFGLSFMICLVFFISVNDCFAFTQSKNFQIVGFEHPNIELKIYRVRQEASAMYRLPNHNHRLLLYCNE